MDRPNRQPTIQERLARYKERVAAYEQIPINKRYTEEERFKVRKMFFERKEVKPLTQPFAVPKAIAQSQVDKTKRREGEGYFTFVGRIKEKKNEATQPVAPRESRGQTLDERKDQLKQRINTELKSKRKEEQPSEKTNLFAVKKTEEAPKKSNVFAKPAEPSADRKDSLFQLKKQPPVTDITREEPRAEAEQPKKDDEEKSVFSKWSQEINSGMSEGNRFNTGKFAKKISKDKTENISQQPLEEEKPEKVNMFSQQTLFFNKKEERAAEHRNPVQQREEEQSPQKKGNKGSQNIFANSGFRKKESDEGEQVNKVVSQPEPKSLFGSGAASNQAQTPSLFSIKPVEQGTRRDSLGSLFDFKKKDPAPEETPAQPIINKKEQPKPVEQEEPKDQHKSLFSAPEGTTINLFQSSKPTGLFTNHPSEPPKEAEAPLQPAQASQPIKPEAVKSNLFSFNPVTTPIAPETQPVVPSKGLFDAQPKAEEPPKNLFSFDGSGKSNTGSSLFGSNDTQKGNIFGGPSTTGGSLFGNISGGMFGNISAPVPNNDEAEENEEDDDGPIEDVDDARPELSVGSYDYIQTDTFFKEPAVKFRLNRNEIVENTTISVEKFSDKDHRYLYVRMPNKCIAFSGRILPSSTVRTVNNAFNLGITGLLFTNQGKPEVAEVKVQFREEEKGKKLLECMEESIQKAKN